MITQVNSQVLLALLPDVCAYNEVERLPTRASILRALEWLTSRPVTKDYVAGRAKVRLICDPGSNGASAEGQAVVYSRARAVKRASAGRLRAR